jgi:acyl-coenzyme A synthetase/AMP-(fatty) acid ligase
MASITMTTEQPITDAVLKQIYRECENNLPSYARPRFLRFLEDMPVTSTFKLRKVEVAQEGFDPAKVSDPLFYRNTDAKTYSTLTHAVYPTLLTKAKL